VVSAAELILKLGNILHKENTEHITKGYKTEISKIL
jgi:hypothetical protein